MTLARLCVELPPGASVGPASGDPGALEVKPQRSGLSNRCTEGHKAGGRLAASEAGRLHLKWLHVVKLNESLQIYFLLGMLNVWPNALNLTERPSFVGGNIEENEYKEEMKNSSQLEIRRTLFLCVCVFLNFNTRTKVFRAWFSFFFFSFWHCLNKSFPHIWQWSSWWSSPHWPGWPSQQGTRVGQTPRHSGTRSAWH